MGGTWRIRPTKGVRALATVAASSPGTGRLSSTVPERSWVSVETPSLTVARYSLSSSTR